ncbi:hypothetical protein [Acinetobacter stercoris]|uniref:Uncharacterized protein n=1 Tax=Acinetobacter stercoris TaxID=2126983 RepID=A0A2U3MVF4_9GAMM|nr:hypothetical protein [Acinetobacter stercoris]SPL69418.1 hypothetical protein KPC_0596 [Acinetobacter stercoris]
MKNLLGYISVLTICGTILASSMSFAQSKPEQNPVIILKHLNFKSFFMQFYRKEIRYLKMQDQQSDEAVGLDDGKGNVNYAVFMPVQQYKNVQGEERYIVWIQIYEQDDGKINNGHPDHPLTELYLFKKLANGSYQFLSQSYPEMNVSGSWGESHLTADAFKGIHRVGKNQMGFTYDGGYTSTGEVSYWKNLIVLNEKGWIQQYPFGYSSSNIGAYTENDPEFGAYSIDYQLKPNPDADGLYPVVVRYSKSGKMDWRNDIPENATKRTAYFNSKKNCYVWKTDQCL